MFLKYEPLLKFAFFKLFLAIMHERVKNTLTDSKKGCRPTIYSIVKATAPFSFAKEALYETNI